MTPRPRTGAAAKYARNAGHNIMVSIRSLAFALLTLLAVSQSAAAADLADLMQPLASDDFDQKADAIRALGASGDPGAIRIQIGRAHV